MTGKGLGTDERDWTNSERKKTMEGRAGGGAAPRWGHEGAPGHPRAARPPGGFGSFMRIQLVGWQKLGSEKRVLSGLPGRAKLEKDGSGGGDLFNTFSILFNPLNRLR